MSPLEQFRRHSVIGITMKTSVLIALIALLIIGCDRGLHSGHGDRITDIDFSPDGSKVVTCSVDKTVRIWNAATGVPLSTIDNPRPLLDLEVSPLGNTIASVDTEGKIRLHDLDAGELVDEFSGDDLKESYVEFSGDGKTIVSSSRLGGIRLWDADSGALKKEIEESYRATSRKGRILSPDGKWLISRTRSHLNLATYDATTGELVLKLGGHTEDISDLVFSPDSKTVITGCLNGVICISDLTSGSVINAINAHSGSITDLSIDGTGELLVSCSDDRSIKVWDIAKAENLHTLQGHKHWVASAVFSPNGKMVASISVDKTVKIWDLASGKSMRTFTGHTVGIHQLAISPDGTRIATGGMDTFLGIWEVAE